MKRPLLQLALAVLAGFAFARPLAAQKPVWTEHSYNGAVDFSVACNGQEDCDQKLRDHMCQAHNICGSSTRRTSTMSSRRAMGWLWLYGGITGGLLGSLKDSQRTDQQKNADIAAGRPPAAAVYALIGAGSGFVLGLLMKVTSGYSTTGPLHAVGRHGFTGTSPFSGRALIGVQWPAALRQ